MTTTTSQDIILPIIHLNGDSADTLIANLKKQYRSLSTAMITLKRGAPNARNYYPDPGRYEQALEQFNRRHQLLKDMQEELLVELQGIQCQAKR